MLERLCWPGNNFEILPGALGKVTVERNVWVSLLKLQPLDPTSKGGWMNVLYVIVQKYLVLDGAICSTHADYVAERTYLSRLPQSFDLFAVDVALHAGLASVNESSMPHGESSQSYCNRAADVRQGYITT